MVSEFKAVLLISILGTAVLVVDLPFSLLLPLSAHIQLNFIITRNYIEGELSFLYSEAEYKKKKIWVRTQKKSFIYIYVQYCAKVLGTLHV